ncbi:SDR family oxidoreductase [Pseudooceanicola onchidii]|uniref:SDR family oxidoreductase n=1 Tax=Pseudooceanicola onchidii TaxID=2562279 RepID=UPI0010AA389F|nr:SDR family oxidoreductase [Pseudooceanicola onchidii]
MDLALKGKTALVTGGTKGIGLACARALIAEGVRVVIAGRSQDSVDAALAGLDGAQGLHADLRSAEDAARMVEDCRALIGEIDILISSAGAAQRTVPEKLTPEHWRAAMDAKFFSYINVIDPVVKTMAARGAGRIVNIIGAGGKLASPIHLPGGSANAALMLATAGLAQAYAGEGIRVIGLNPGATRTTRLTEGLKAQAEFAGTTYEEAERAAASRIPLGRMAEPEEVADMAVFLASDRASYVTGVTINMDGAVTATVV